MLMIKMLQNGHITGASAGMLKAYLKLVWRNLVKDRQFTLLNVLGLSVWGQCDGPAKAGQREAGDRADPRGLYAVQPGNGFRICVSQ